MDDKKSYKKLLNRMFLVERMGEIIYKSLASKTKNTDLKALYERLAHNEYETAKCIGKEAKTVGINCGRPTDAIALTFTKVLCTLLTEKQIIRFLSRILKRRIYGNWHNRYKDRNPNFWLKLLSHENLQHELLSPLWSCF